jgi:Uncharacterized conserved protein
MIASRRLANLKTEGFQMNLKILGGAIEIKDPTKFIEEIRDLSEDSVVQVVNADFIVGREHVEFAVKKALNSFKSGKNISRDLSIEIMLYLSGKRNIDKAMGIGVKKGKNDALFILYGDDTENLEKEIKDRYVIEEKDLLKYDKSKNRKLMEFFGITKEEIEAVGEEKIPKLVMERVILLDILK